MSSTGVERGLDLKIGAREQTQQTARPIVTQPTPARRFDDLLPTLKRAAIITRQDDDTTPLESIHELIKHCEQEAAETAEALKKPRGLFWQN